MARKKKSDIKTFSAFTEHGAVKLALIYQSLGKKVLTRPEYNPQTTLWQFDVLWTVEE